MQRCPRPAGCASPSRMLRTWWGVRHLRYWWAAWQRVQVRYTPEGEIVWMYHAVDWAYLGAVWEGKG
jgi:hypothetical protein